MGIVRGILLLVIIIIKVDLVGGMYEYDSTGLWASGRSAVARA